MATGCASLFPATEEERRESLTCSVCLEIFTDPRLLPCHHTFCLKCLQDLHNSQPSGFPCPQCRAKVVIPSAGVGAFPKNFYLHKKDLEIAKEETVCLTHPKQELDLFCQDCKAVVCLKCILTKHKQHNTCDLADEVLRVKAQLQQHKARLQTTMCQLRDNVHQGQQEQQDLDGKKAALRRSIHNKHATLIAMADKLRDGALASLDETCKKIENDGSSDVTQALNSLDQLNRLQQRLEDALESGKIKELLAVSMEMTNGKGSRSALGKLSTLSRSVCRRPVLSMDLSDEQMMNKMSKYFGAVSEHTLQISQPEVSVEQVFVCRSETDIEDIDTEVYCLCLYDDTTVNVTYTRRCLSDMVPTDLFTESGQHIQTKDHLLGKVSLKAEGNGGGLVLRPQDDMILTHSKSFTTSSHYRLHNMRNGKGKFNTVTVLSENTFKTSLKPVFNINVGLHRTHDVDSGEQFFVVVEEPKPPATKRLVLLYQKPQADPVACYQPPSPQSQPCDVCFYTLGGQELLLVADEGTDSIHVVQVRPGSLTFLRYLAPGCPLIVQPTALNNDESGGLWVACRGGAILKLTRR